MVVLSYAPNKTGLFEMFKCDSATLTPWSIVSALGYAKYAKEREGEEKRMMRTYKECMGVGMIVVTCPNLPMGEGMRGKQVDSLLLVPLFNEDLMFPVNPRWENQLKLSLSTKKTIHNRE